MKKIILSLVALLVLGIANAQETKEVEKVCPLKFGVKGGANYDWLATGTFSVHDLRPEIGTHIGVLAEYKLCDKFAVQTEVLFSHSNYSFDGNGNDSGDRLEVSQLLVPVLGKFYLAKKISLEAGLQGGLVLSASMNSVDAQDEFRKYTVASVSGLAYDFDNGLFLQARYVYNFLDLLNTPTGNNAFGVQASIGCKF
jgi:hypothetical protein